MDSTPEVEYELTTVGDLYGKFSNNDWNVHHSLFTPYRLRFTKLPAQQGTFTIKFKTIDKLGQERIFNVELTTEERSKAVFDDPNGFYLTNADVKFTPNTETAILNKEGIVSVPRSDAEQTIGKKVTTSSSFSTDIARKTLHRQQDNAALWIELES